MWDHGNVVRSLAQNEFTYILLPTPTAEEMWSASSDARLHAAGLLLHRDQYAQKPLLTRMIVWRAKILNTWWSEYKLADRNRPFTTHGIPFSFK
jgi:hypothetical protein